MELWRATLAAGNTDKAWTQFIERYRPLIIAVIRRSIRDDDDIDDVLSEVCADLCHAEMALPARHSDSGKAKFSTWLVTVVHHKAIDWVRHRDGRRRVVPPDGLLPLQQRIFESIVCRRQTHRDSFEEINAHLEDKLSFAAFMKEVLGTFQYLELTTGRTVAHYFPGPPTAIEQQERQVHEALVLSDTAAAIETALMVLAPDERLAVKLFVIDELSAASVAQIVGWPSAKTVYNRVYRALQVLRREIELHGIDSNDA